MANMLKVLLEVVFGFIGLAIIGGVFITLNVAQIGALAYLVAGFVTVFYALAIIYIIAKELQSG